MSGAPIDNPAAEPIEPLAPQASASPSVDSALVESMNKAIIDLTCEVKALREAQIKNNKISTDNATKFKIRDL